MASFATRSSGAILPKPRYPQSVHRASYESSPRYSTTSIVNPLQSGQNVGSRTIATPKAPHRQRRKRPPGRVGTVLGGHAYVPSNSACWMPPPGSETQIIFGELGRLDRWAASGRRPLGPPRKVRGSQRPANLKSAEPRDELMRLQEA